MATFLRLQVHRMTEVGSHSHAHLKVHSNREDVHKAKVLGVRGEHGGERARDNIAKPQTQPLPSRLAQESYRGSNPPLHPHVRLKMRDYR